MPKVDLNDPEFQQQLFALPKTEILAVFRGMRKLMALNWDEVYRDRGLRWEKVHSTAQFTYYSIRLSQKMRGLVTRQGEFVVFASLHPDHDGAYRP